MVSRCIQLCYYEENQCTQLEHWGTRLHGSSVCWQGSLNVHTADCKCNVFLYVCVVVRCVGLPNSAFYIWINSEYTELFSKSMNQKMLHFDAVVKLHSLLFLIVNCCTKYWFFIFFFIIYEFWSVKCITLIFVNCRLSSFMMLWVHA